MAMILEKTCVVLLVVWFALFMFLPDAKAQTVSYGSSDGSITGTITTESFELDVTARTPFGEVHVTSETAGKFLDSEGIAGHAYNVTDSIVADVAYKQSGNYLIRFASNFNEVGFATSTVSIFQPIVFNRDFSACSSVSHVDWWNHESISLAIGESHDTPFLSINNAAYEMIWAKKSNSEKTYGWWNIQRTGMKTYVYSARFNISEIGECIEFDPTYDSMPGSFYDDTYVSQGNATTNYNSGTVFYLGLVAGPNEYEAGFHIYAASLATAAGLSTPLNLDSAEMQFKESAVLASGAANAHWGIPTADVNFSLVTWNLKPTLVNIDNPISIANTGSATNTIDGTEFTQLVEDWINGATPNYGIWIDSNSSSGDRTEFVSQEGTADPYFSFTTEPEYDFIAQSAILSSDEFIIGGTQALSDEVVNISSITVKAFSDQTLEITEAATKVIKNGSNGLWVVIADAPTAFQAVNSIITVNSGNENITLPVFIGGGSSSGGFETSDREKLALVHGDILKLATNQNDDIASVTATLSTISTNITDASAALDAIIREVGYANGILDASAIVVPAFNFTYVRDGNITPVLSAIGNTSEEPNVSFHLLENGVTDQGSHNMGVASSFTWGVSSATDHYLHTWTRTSALNISSSTGDYRFEGSWAINGVAEKFKFGQGLSLLPLPSVDTSDLFTDADADTFLGKLLIAESLHGQRFKAQEEIARTTAGLSASTSIYVPAGRLAVSQIVLSGATKLMVADYAEDASDHINAIFTVDDGVDALEHFRTFDSDGKIVSATQITWE